MHIKKLQFQYKPIFNVCYTDRKHTPRGLEYFKNKVLKKYSDPAVPQHESLFVTDAEDPAPMIRKKRTYLK